MRNESESILEKLSAEQREALYNGYRMLKDEHNLSEKRVMRMLKLKEYELKTLRSFIEEKAK